MKIATIKSEIVKGVHLQPLNRVLLAGAIILIPLSSEAQVLLGSTSVSSILEYASMTNYPTVGPRQQRAPIPGVVSTSGQFGPGTTGYVAGSWRARSIVTAVEYQNALSYLEVGTDSRAFKDMGNQSLHQISGIASVSLDIEINKSVLVRQISGIGNFYEITGDSNGQTVRSFAGNRLTNLQTNTVLKELIKEETVQSTGSATSVESIDISYVLDPGRYRLSVYSNSYSFGVSGFIGRNASSGATTRLIFSPVPEPTSVTAIALGLAMMLKRRKKTS